MTKIKCRAIDCIFWDIGFCSADEITYDLEEGCLTYEVLDDLPGEEWDGDLDDLGAEEDNPLVYPYNNDGVGDGDDW